MKQFLLIGYNRQMSDTSYEQYSQTEVWRLAATWNRK